MFFRVLPEYYLRELRDEIVEQISPYGCIPPDYVFLRSVGRCLTQVSTLSLLITEKMHINDGYDSFRFRTEKI